MNTNPRTHWRTTGRGAISLFLLGMIGVVALAVYTVPTLRSIPELTEFPDPVLFVVAALNSTLVLAVFTVLGVFAAPRVGLQSHVFEWATREGLDWRAFRASLPRAVGLGAGMFVIATLLQVAFAQFLNVEVGAFVSETESLGALAASIPMRLLYGGITEEVLLRWGVMAPIAWVIWRLGSLGRTRGETPSASIVWAAIILSAVLFGLGHLPSVAASYTLTIPLVAQIVVLNTIVGIGFGWLFWRYSLETAMVAHMVFHVTLVVISTAVILVT